MKYPSIVRSPAGYGGINHINWSLVLLLPANQGTYPWCQPKPDILFFLHSCLSQFDMFLFTPMLWDVFVLCVCSCWVVSHNVDMHIWYKILSWFLFFSLCCKRDVFISLAFVIIFLLWINTELDSISDLFSLVQFFCTWPVRLAAMTELCL